MSLSCPYPANSSCSDGTFTMLAVVKRTAWREEAGMEQGRVLGGRHGQWVIRGHCVRVDAGKHDWEAPVESGTWAQWEPAVLAGRRGGTLCYAVRKVASRFLSDGVALNDLIAQMVCAAGGQLWAPCMCRGELRAPAFCPGGSPLLVTPACLLGRRGGGVGSL